ncbi:MAG TPA: 2'-5' RNA ligase family protein [Candidatus Limnocylindria bacterium]
MPEARTEGDSGLIVPIPGAEPVIGELRLLHDPSAPRGVPAHVTVLYPFMPRHEIDDDVRRVLGKLFSQFSPFTYSCSEVRRFGDSTVYLVPEPTAAFSVFTRAVVTRWPVYQPYGGAYEIVVPHLTVGDALTGLADRLVADARSAIERNGPIMGRAEVIWLMTLHDGRWSVDSIHELGGSEPVSR